MSNLPATTSTAPATTDNRPGTLAELIDQAIQHADQQRTELAEAGDIPALAHGLDALRAVNKKLSILIGQTDGDLSRLNRAEGGNQAVDGLGVLETHAKSARTRWDSDRLYGRLVDAITAAAVVDPTTGEMTGDAATAASVATMMRDVMASCLPLTASMGWRVTGLKKLGIDPDQYRDREFGGWTTRIVHTDGGQA